jgi:hypothetical protein
VAQSDRLVWPVDEGPAEDYVLLTQHVFDVAAGSYVAEVGAVHRSAVDRDVLVGGPIGQTLRIPVTLAASGKAPA